MNANQVIIIKPTGEALKEEVGKYDYHDSVLAKMFIKMIDKKFQMSKEIYSDNAASIVENYHYVVVFETYLNTVAMFPKEATLEQKIYFFNNFYSKKDDLILSEDKTEFITKRFEVGVKEKNGWRNVEDIEQYLNDFEFKIGGRV